MAIDRLVKFTHAPMLIPAAATALGIGAYLVAPSLVTLAVLAALSIALIIAVSLRRPQGMLFALATAATFASIGALDTYIRTPADIDSLNSAPLLSGTIEKCDATTTGARITINVDTSIDSLGRAARLAPTRILLFTDHLPVDAGNRLAFRAEITPIAKAAAGFDSQSFQRNMRAKNIRYSAFVSSVEPTHIFSDMGADSGLKSHITRCRLRFSDKLLSSGLRPDTKAFINALLCGDSSLITSSQRTLFSECGIAHLLALSGLHIGILAALIIELLIPLAFVVNYKLRYVIAILICWAFTIFTGMAPSTIRACTMLSIYFVGYILERSPHPINTLATAFLLLLLIDPFSLVDTGFQLSFISVGAIIFLASRLNPFDQRHHHTTHRIAALIISSLVAIAATSMVTAYHFGNIQLLALPVNFIAIPMMTPYLALAFLYAALLHLGLDLYPLRLLLDNAYDILLSLASATHTAPIPVSPPYSAYLLWVAGLMLLAFAIVVRRKGRIKYLPAATAVAAALIITFITPQQKEEGLIVNTIKGQLQVEYQDAADNGTDIFTRGASAIIKRSGHTIAVIQHNLEKHPENFSWSKPTPIASNNASSQNINTTIHGNAPTGTTEVNPDVIILAGSYSGSLSDVIRLIRSRQSTITHSHMASDTPEAKHDIEKPKEAELQSCPYSHTRPTIILGPHLRAAVRKRIRYQADSLRLPVHSLRDQGPYIHIIRH